VVRAVYIKGSTLSDLSPVLTKLAGFALFFNALAMWSYKKRTA
jgi:ABC-2 type transport system permease protein